ncbi:MAG: PcfJ domain-containing protein [Turicibacter bilis]|nr:PcfJ domain-containing protein [Turicibacter bilis]
MKLTREEKNALLNATLELLKANENSIYTSHEMLESLERELVSPTVLTNILNAYINDMHENACIIVKGTRPYRYSYIDTNKVIMIDSFKKDKNLLVFSNADNTKTISYDFNTHKMSENDYIIQYADKKLKELFSMIQHHEIKEWLFSYTDLIEDYHDMISINFDCPKGYINFLKENNLTINQETYIKYIMADKLHGNLRAVDMYYNFMFNIMSLNNIKINYYLNNFTFIEKLNKSYIVSAKNFEIYPRIIKDMKDILDYAYVLKNLSIIDTNRGINYNLKLYTSAYNDYENIVLNNNLKRLNFLNGLTFDDYIVIVPQQLSDLQNEGSQQNNCVGYYYNNSIKRGENLIYFMRKVNNPTKSVVTCRYNVEDSRTVEHRIVNNSWTNDEQETIINKIDEIIRKNLK